MQNYQNFSVCTRNALDYACAHFRTDIPQAGRENLMAGYKTLPAFPDVKEGLEELVSEDFRMFAFSNGLAEDVAGLLRNAGIDHYFDGVVSVDEIRSFKPNPAVYCHFLRRAQATGREAWLISANPFDVIGAISAGMNGAWIQRSAGTLYDPWGIGPTITVPTIRELRNGITGFTGR